MILSLLKLYNSYHKLYRPFDILRTEDSLTEIKKTKQNSTINKRKQLWAPLKEVSHKVYEYWLVLLVCFLDMRFGRLVESQAIQLQL